MHRERRSDETSRSHAEPIARANQRVAHKLAISRSLDALQIFGANSNMWTYQPKKSKRQCEEGVSKVCRGKAHHKGIEHSEITMCLHSFLDGFPHLSRGPDLSIKANNISKLRRILGYRRSVSLSLNTIGQNLQCVPCHLPFKKRERPLFLQGLAPFVRPADILRWKIHECSKDLAVKLSQANTKQKCNQNIMTLNTGTFMVQTLFGVASESREQYLRQSTVVVAFSVSKRRVQKRCFFFVSLFV